MNSQNVYRYKDFMADEFPFKIEIKDNRNYNGKLHAHEHMQLCYVS